MEEKEQTVKLRQKWWFWLMIVIIIAIISFAVVIGIALNIIKDEVADFAKDVQEIYEDATVYSSAGKNILMIKLINYDNNTDVQKLNEIINKTKEEVKNGKLKMFNKLIIMTYINGDSQDKENYLIIEKTLSLPDFEQKSEKQYINWSEYEYMYNALKLNTELLTSGLY